MLVTHGRFIASLHLRANYQRGDASSAIAHNCCRAAIVLGLAIALEISFIPNNEHDPVAARLKFRQSEDCRYVLGKPGISRGQCPIVGIVYHARCDVSVIRGAVVCDVSRKLAVWY